MILVITTGRVAVAPHVMLGLLTQTQQVIERQLQKRGDQPLLPSEIPFSYTERGLQVIVNAPPHRAIALTWGLLNDAVLGLFNCAYNAGRFSELSAVVLLRENEGPGLYTGTLGLTTMYRADTA